MFWSTVGRLILVPVAALLAAAAAGFVAVTLGLERLTQDFHGKDVSFENAEGYLQLVDLGVMMASAVTLLPALAVIIIGEVARVRSSLYYIVGGGGALAAIPLLASAAAPGGLAVPPTVVWQVLATAGFVGGFVYWLVAGRSA